MLKQSVKKGVNARPETAIHRQACLQGWPLAGIWGQECPHHSLTEKLFPAPWLRLSSSDDAERRPSCWETETLRRARQRCHVTSPQGNPGCRVSGASLGRDITHCTAFSSLGRLSCVTLIGERAQETCGFPQTLSLALCDAAVSL